MNVTRLKQLLTEDDAVSPVIGVILMVAITVILAAVIGTFVLGLGQNVQSSAPQANFQFNYAANDYSGTGNTFTITHNGGEDISAGSLTVSASSTSTTYTTFTGTDWEEQVSTGDSLTITDGTELGDFGSGDTIRVIWNSPSGGTSNTIGQSEVPT